MISHHRKDADMDQQFLAALARAAGLEKALAEFPQDVAAAAAQALNNAGAIQFPDDPAAEPWPPMRAGIGL
jgi:hypothetical protein